MPMLCSNCMETKDEGEFFVLALNRFVARCAACRSFPATPRAPRPPEQRMSPQPRSNIALIRDAGVAADLAFVIDQLPERV